MTRDFDDDDRPRVTSEYAKGRDWGSPQDDATHTADFQRVPQGYELDADGTPKPVLEMDFLRRTRGPTSVQVASSPHLWPIAAQEYARTGRMSAAAAALGCATQTVRNLAKSNEEFGALMAEAHETYVAKLHSEAMRRGYEGVTRPLLYKGEVVATQQEYSDNFLLLELRRVDPQIRELLAPAKAGSTTVNVTATASAVAPGTPLERLAAARLTPEQRLALRALVGTPEPALGSTEPNAARALDTTQPTAYASGGCAVGSPNSAPGTGTPEPEIGQTTDHASPEAAGASPDGPEPDPRPDSADGTSGPPRAE